MASKEKQVMKTNHSQQKQYSYSYGNTTLNFTLRTDIKSEMKDFLLCLNQAVAEVEADLKTKK